MRYALKIMKSDPWSSEAWTKWHMFSKHGCLLWFGSRSMRRNTARALSRSPFCLLSWSSVPLVFDSFTTERNREKVTRQRRRKITCQILQKRLILRRRLSSLEILTLLIHVSWDGCTKWRIDDRIKGKKFVWVTLNQYKIQEKCNRDLGFLYCRLEE